MNGGHRSGRPHEATGQGCIIAGAFQSKRREREREKSRGATTSGAATATETATAEASPCDDGDRRAGVVCVYQSKQASGYYPTHDRPGQRWRRPAGWRWNATENTHTHTHTHTQNITSHPLGGPLLHLVEFFTAFSCSSSIWTGVKSSISYMTRTFHTYV